MIEALKQEVGGMSEELKPCPFCGGYPELLELPDLDKSSGWTIRCCDIDDFAYESLSPDECAQKWNTRADLPAAVTVKPLEWEHFDLNYPKWVAEAPLWGGMFRAKIDKGEPSGLGKFPLFIQGSWDGKKHQNLNSAKSAAQAAYHKLNALTPVPVADPVAAIKEAYKLASECDLGKASLYDEEGVEGWQWTHPSGREWYETGDWDESPPIHPELDAALRALCHEGQS